eukprot:SAG11_NODE_7320_length_1160_cov_118.809614_1_plen_172_part_00
MKNRLRANQMRINDWRDELHDYIIKTYGASENRLPLERFHVHDKRGPIPVATLYDSGHLQTPAEPEEPAAEPEEPAAEPEEPAAEDEHMSYDDRQMIRTLRMRHPNLARLHADGVRGFCEMARQLTELALHLQNIHHTNPELNVLRTKYGRIVAGVGLPNAESSDDEDDDD